MQGRKGGHIAVFDPAKGREEVTECFTCAHCQAIVPVPAFVRAADAGGFCYGCGKCICSKCVAKRKCTPIEKWLDNVERSYHARRSYDEAAR